MENITFYEFTYNNYVTNSIREIHVYSFGQIPLVKLQNIYLNENEEIASARYLSRSEIEDWFIPGNPSYLQTLSITKSMILDYFLSCENTLEEYPNSLDEIRTHLLHKNSDLWKKMQKSLLFSLN